MSILDPLSDAVCWKIVGVIILVYVLIYVPRPVVRAARKGELIVGKKLSVGHLLGAIAKGLKVPAIVTLVGAVAATVFYIAQDPDPHDPDPASWEPQSWIHVFTGLTLTVQIMLVLVVLCVGLFYGGKAVKRYLLAPLCRSIVSLSKKVRPWIPVRR